MSPYNTVIKESISELSIQKSRFITYLIPVQSESDASSQLERIRKSHWDATHHVPAWILSNGIQKFSDDGEPGGTAGMPVLESLKHGEMMDCMLVVVRYFGGVKLGTGGLVRAYGQAARETLANADLYRVDEYDHVRVCMEYTHLGRVQSRLMQSDVLGIETVFTDMVELIFFVRTDRTADIQEVLTDLTNGDAVISIIDRMSLAVKGTDFIRYG